MLIAFQKSSQNREATQNGGVFSLEKKRDFTIHWPAHNFKEQAFVRSCSFFCVSCAFLKLPQFSILLFLPLFGMLASSPTESKPSYSASLLFSRLYSITPKQGHAQHTHPRYSRCGRALLSGLCSVGKLRARWQDWGGSKSLNKCGHQILIIIQKIIRTVLKSAAHYFYLAGHQACCCPTDSEPVIHRIKFTAIHLA